MLESKRKAIIFITISFLLAIVAGVFTLKQVSALNEELGGMTEIYVAATDIPSRTQIKPEHLTTMKIPKRFLVENSHIETSNSEELINKVLVVPVSEGSIITKEIVKPFSEAINKNNRLVAIPKSDRIFFDREDLHALDRIDIVVSHNFDGQPKTEIFMKDVLVFSTLKKENEFRGVMVEIPVEDAPKIIHMENYSDSMRILKASVGKDSVIINENQENEIVEEVKEEVDQVNTEEQTNGVEPIDTGGQEAEQQ